MSFPYPPASLLASAVGLARPGHPGRRGLRLLLTLCLLASALAGRAQVPPPSWTAAQALAQVNSGLVRVQGTAVTATGDVYITGLLFGRTLFGTLVIPAAPDRRGFVAKWSAASQSWVWAVPVGSTSSQGNGIAVSGSNVYVAGFFAGTSNVIAGTTLTGQGTSPTTGTSSDVFLAKFIDNGTSVANGWAVSGGGTDFDQATGVAVSGSSVYLSGSFSSSAAALAGTALTGLSTGGTYFLAKYTDQGTSAAGGWLVSGNGNANAVALNGSSVYLGGSFAGTTSVAGTALSSTAGSSDSFVAKYVDQGSGAGNGWVAVGRGAGTEITYGLAVSGSAVYATGTCGASAVMAGTTLGSAAADVFVAKYTDSGPTATNGWATSGGGGANEEVGRGVAVSGNAVYVAGYFSGSSAIAGTTLSSQASPAANYNGFVARYTDNGPTASASWAVAAGAGVSSYAYGVAVSGSSVYAALEVRDGRAQFGSLPTVSGNVGGVGRLEGSTGAWQEVIASRNGGYSSIKAVATNAAGDVFVAGYVYGQATLGALTVSSHGDEDLLLAKWSATTQSWAWATTDGGYNLEEAVGLAVSGSSVYVTGTFLPSASTQSTSIAGAALTGAGNSFFVAKYLDQGTSVGNGWGLAGGTGNNSISYGLAANGASVYVAGAFFGSATIAGTPLTSVGGFDMFVAKYVDQGPTATGGWAVAGGSSGTDTAYGIATSGTSVYVTGSFNTTATIAGTPLTSAGSSDVFVAKYVDQGSAAASGWAVRGGGTGFDYGYSLATSGSGVFVAGTIGGAATIAGTALPNAGGYDMYVARYTDAGPTATDGWAVRGGGTGNDLAYSVAVRGSKVYASGGFVGTATIAGTALTGQSTVSPDCFVAQYTDGTTSVSESGAAAGGSAGGADYGYGLAVVGTSVYMGGKTGAPAMFGTITPAIPDVFTDLTVGVLAQLTTAAPAPDLVISTPGQAVPAGTYNSITVQSGGVATLQGSGVVVNAGVAVQSGGTLDTNCVPLTGSGSFMLAAGATLVVCDAAGLSATAPTGAVQLAGTRSFAADASYVYSGTQAQSTGDGLPTQVRSLRTTNANTLTLTRPLAVAQTLTIGGAGNLATAGQALTLLSAATGTALVVNAGTGVVVGAATVQRYIDPSLNANGAGYRHYAPPVTNTTVADLATTTGFTPTVNPGYNTSATPATVTPFPTVFAYDAGRVGTVASTYGLFDQGWKSPGSLGEALNPGQGYAVQLGNGQLVDFVGTLGTGDRTVALTNAGVGPAASTGWALVGNPYPAPLDWSQVQPTDRPGLDAALYVVQSTGPYAGGYRTYTNGQSTSATNNPLVASSQGFFVHLGAGQTSGSLTFRNTQRVADYATAQAATFQRPAADLRPALRLELAGAGLADAWVAYAEAGATAGPDGQYDATKLPNPLGLNLSSTAAGGQPLAIDGRPAFGAATVLPLLVSVPAAGPYTLTAAALANLPAGLDAYLRDAATGQTLKLGLGSSYSFVAAAAGTLAGRFAVVFDAGVLATAPALAGAAVQVYPNPAHEVVRVAVPGVAGASQVQAELRNGLGQVVARHTQALPTAGTTLALPTAGLAAGLYVLRLTAGPAAVALRVVVQ